MSNQFENSSKDNNANQTVKTALDKAVKNLSNVSAPLLILSIAKNFRDAINFITNNFLITMITLSLLAILFFLNLLREIKLKIRKPHDKPTVLHKNKFTAFGIVMTSFALILIVVILSIFDFTGVHYVMIASYKMPTVSMKVEEINTFLDQNGVKGLKAKAYASKSPNPYYAVMIGGPHFSKASARKTYSRARTILSNYIDREPQLVSQYLFKPKELVRL
jgi:hypothetical protein